MLMLIFIISLLYYEQTVDIIFYPLVANSCLATHASGSLVWRYSFGLVGGFNPYKVKQMRASRGIHDSVKSVLILK